MTRHMSGSIVVSIDDNDGVTAHSYFYVFQADRPDSPGPLPAESYLMVEYDDELRMTDAGCKFAKREFKIIFMGQH